MSNKDKSPQLKVLSYWNLNSVWKSSIPFYINLKYYHIGI